MARWNTTEDRRLRRHHRIRKKVVGTVERPRLTIRRTLNQIYAQIVDDTTGRTIVSASSVGKEAKGKLGGAKSKADRSKVVGKMLAERAKAAGISRVSFDRAGYLYHGRVKALADGAREGGLSF
jgi:large subunit ribosomal protein L18